MNNQETIDILLATYNGGRFLRDQIESILRQTDTRWRLLIRDDGSTDETCEIIGKFAAAHRDRVRVLSDGQTSLGAVGNFATLLRESTAEYGMFCDQDDVWLPEKIAKCRQMMAVLEAKHDADTPLFVHTDLRVVDSGLNEIAPSFLRFRSIDPVIGRKLERLLVQNFAPGCASMFNAVLRRKALPVPSEAIMHDWWMALVAASLGGIGFVCEPLVLYRQHAGNQLGAGGGAVTEAIADLLARPSVLWNWSETRVRQSQRQAQALEMLLGDLMQSSIRERVHRYARLGDKNVFARRFDLIRYGYRRNGSFLKNLALFLFV